jgi:hypothetical protein
MGRNTKRRKRTKSRRRKSKRKVHQNRSRSKRRRKGTRKRRRGGTTPAIRRAEKRRAGNTDRRKQMAKFTARYNAARDLPYGPVGAPPRDIDAIDKANRQRFKNAMTISNHLTKSQYKEDMGNDAERDLTRMRGVPPAAARNLRDMNYGPSRAARGTMAAHARQ